MRDEEQQTWALSTTGPGTFPVLPSCGSCPILLVGGPWDFQGIVHSPVGNRNHLAHRFPQKDILLCINACRISPELSSGQDLLGLKSLSKESSREHRSSEGGSPTELEGLQCQLFKVVGGREEC